MNSAHVAHAFFSLSEYAAARSLPDTLDVSEHAEQWSMPPSAFPVEPLTTCLAALRGQIPGIPHLQQPALEAHLSAGLLEPHRIDWATLVKQLIPVLQPIVTTILTGVLAGAQAPADASGLPGSDLAAAPLKRGEFPTK